jgi:hypothetical protein
MKCLNQRPLTAALLFTLIAHGLGMVTMAVFLLPGMPGGTHLDIASRAAYVAAHPWVWRAGWFGWQLTAVSDLLLAVALVATKWIPRVPATLTLLCTILTLIPDQYGQAIWTWQGVRLAQSAVATEDFAGYLRFENETFRLIAGLGTIGYLASALGWTWCFAAAGTWDRRLTWLSVATWGLFAFATAMIFVRLPPGAAKVVSGGNAIAFVLLMLWLILVTRKVSHRQSSR